MVYKMYVSAGGIGDSVCGLYAAAGIADSLPEGDTVEFHTRNMMWLDRFIHPRVTLLPHIDGTDMGVDMNYEYDLHLRESRSRKQWYADAVTRGYGLPAAAARMPLMNLEGALPPDDYYPNSYVMLAPFSVFESRAWPISQWLKLTQELASKGWRVMVVSSAGDEDRLKANFAGANCQYYWGMNPGWVVDTMLNAALVIGNDSGMAHLSALHQVPTVAMLAQLSPRLVFSHTDVQCVMPRSACSPCAWQGSRGWIESCDRLGCAALQSISFSEVYHRADSILRNQR